jgi:hypothetical protein
MNVLSGNTASTASKPWARAVAINVSLSGDDTMSGVTSPEILPLAAIISFTFVVTALSNSQVGTTASKDFFLKYYESHLPRVQCIAQCRYDGQSLDLLRIRIG